ncbi:hypothetical protein V1524DRAFT_409223 [Lipomyces starkeyi]
MTACISTALGFKSIRMRITGLGFQGFGADWRPLWWDNPSDTNAYGIDTQFALGNGLLVTPVLTEGATIVTGYFPEMASSMIGTLEPRNRLPQAKDA